MLSIRLNLPAFGFIVGTRAALGVGIGLLVSGRLPAVRRRAVGTTLVAIGAATTIPAAMLLIRNTRRLKALESPLGQSDDLIGISRFPRKGDDLGPD